MTPRDDDMRARRGFALALAGAASVPVLVALLAVLPRASRKTVFVLGLAAIGSACLWGGSQARSAMTGSTTHRVRAVVGALLGLILGVTAAVFLFWTLVGVVL